MLSFGTSLLALLGVSGMSAVAKANVSLPALLLLDADGDVIWVKPRPKDTAAVDALLKEVRP